MLSAGLPLAGGNNHLLQTHRNRSIFFDTSKPIRITSFTVQSSSSSSLTELNNTSSSSEVEDDQKFSFKVGGTVSFPPLKAAKRVVLVRHGQSTWNAEGRIQGSSDFSVLTNKGEAQAETSRQMLIDDSFDICFSSPLKRSKRTADVIWDSRKEEILTDSDLREIDLYSFQGLLKHEGIAKFGEAFGMWQKDAPNFNIDGHYPVRELWDRASSCWQKILVHDSRSVLVVAHNAVNQALVATAMGLGTEYFRILLQSNCGVSVLDFVPRPEGGSPYICLNRLNQTPGSPIGGGSSAGRKASKRIVLVCHGSSQESINASCLQSGWINEFEDELLTEIWGQSGTAWKSLLDELSNESEPENVVVAVGHPIVNIGLLAHCLNLTKDWIGSFHLDAGSISVIDFPDGPYGRGVVRCINYSAHLGRWSIPITRTTQDDEAF